MNTASFPMPLCLLCLVALLSACQTAPTRGDSAALAALDDSVAQSTTPPAAPLIAPPEVAAALLPPLRLDLNIPSQAVEPRFDMTVDQAPARGFFMSLVKDTPHNMVVHPDVGGTISLTLKNVNVDEVMQTVRDVYGYDYRRSATGYEVLPAQLRSQQFKVNYLNVQRAGESRVRVSSGQVTGARSNANGGTPGAALQPQQQDGVSGSQVDTKSSTNFWAELNDSLTAIIGAEGGRKVIINPQSGIIVVRAMPDELRTVADYLRDTQEVIQRQVILEAKIVEVSLNDGFQAGINWATLGRDGSNRLVAGQFGGASVFTTGASNLRGKTDALNPQDWTNLREDVAGAFGGVFAMSLDIGDFTGFLEFLETQGEVHVLSSPRVSTVNNQKAVIKVGTDEFFVTDVTTQSNTTAAAATNQSVDVELTPFFSGVALDVVPQINETGEVILHIHPSVSEVTEKVKEINLTTDSTLTMPLAQSTIRESDSIVRAHSGQVVVIGGLMQNQQSDGTAGVPLLGSLPFIGKLFQHQQKASRKSELVILLRPVVVTGAETWSDELRRSQREFRGLSSGAASAPKTAAGAAP